VRSGPITKARLDGRAWIQFNFSAPDEAHRPKGPLCALQDQSAGVLQPVFAHHLLHFVFQMEFEFFQTMFFHFLVGSQGVFGLECLNLLLVRGMLFRELAELLTRLHQVRFDFFCCVLFHAGKVSLVESPRHPGPWNPGAGTAGSFTSINLAHNGPFGLCASFSDAPNGSPLVYQDFTMNVFS
jgi:hypothetical protein